MPRASRDDLWLGLSQELRFYWSHYGANEQEWVDYVEDERKRLIRERDHHDWWISVFIGFSMF